MGSASMNRGYISWLSTKILLHSLLSNPTSYKPIFSMLVLTPSIQVIFGLPQLHLRSPPSLSVHLLVELSHALVSCNWFSLILYPQLTTSLRISTFLILSLMVFLHIHLNKHIYGTLIFLMCSFINVQHSNPYNNVGLIAVHFRFNL